MLLAYARVWSFGWVYDDAYWLPAAVNVEDAPGRALFALAGWIGGGLPWAFHGLIVALHLLNGGLLWVVSRRWLTPDGASVALILFWLHPLQVESVAYVTGGVEVLLTTYILIAWIGLTSGSWLGAIVGVASLALALPLKLSALPAVAAVLAYVAWASRWRASALLAAGVALIVAVAPFLFRFGSSATPLAERWEALTAVAVAGWRYLLFVVWPFGFSIEHDWLAVPSLVATGAVIAAGLAALAAGIISSRWSAPWAACLWIGALLLPRALVPGAPPLTEHHTYLPFLAVWILAGAGVDRFSARSLA